MLKLGKKVPFRGLLMVGLFALGLIQATPPSVADNVWQASYWNNRTLSGSPVLTRNENELNNDWGDNAPAAGVNIDDFSARWLRTINISSGLTYRFTASTDDGMRVWVDNNLIIDSWWDSQVHSVQADLFLAQGDHSIKVEYYDAGGKAVAKLNWQPAAANPPGATTMWRGEYFSNGTLSGAPTVIRDDPQINFDWGTGAPAAGVPTDQFSVRWSRQLNLQGGRYEFTMRADDGMRVWVNGQLIIDRWQEAQGQYYQTTIDLPAGSFPIKVEYYENAGGALAFYSHVRLGSGNAGLWRGEYFNNRNLSGTPALVRDDAQPNFNWGSGSPAAAIANDNFSVRWSRDMSFAAGKYRFSILSDDGARVWVNGQLIIDNWSEHPPNTVSNEITLPAAIVPVKIEYFEATGGAQVQFSWSTVNVVPPVPGTGTAIVVSNRLNIRCGPGLQYGILTTVTRGTTLSLAGYRSATGSWVLVNHNGRQSWVSSLPSLLSSTTNLSSLPVWTGNTFCGESTQSGNMNAVVANAQFVNMRQTPFVGQNIIRALPAGTTVQLIGRNQTSSWAQIRLADQTVGWMSTYFLNSSVAISSLPVTSN